MHLGIRSPSPVGIHWEFLGSYGNSLPDGVSTLGFGELMFRVKKRKVAVKEGGRGGEGRGRERDETNNRTTVPVSSPEDSTS